MIVQSSWKVSDGRPVSDAVVASADFKNADLEDEIMVENCVMLEAPDMGDSMYPTNPACQLLISCDQPSQISHVTVLCEARVIEVYGNHGEYLKTVKNVLVEEADDMVVFRGDVVLERPMPLCSIKFLLLRNANEMWLYGVRIHSVTVPLDLHSHTSVPLAAVEQRLVEMGLALSDKAEAFKQLVHSCQNSQKEDHNIGDLIANLALHNLVKNKSPSPNSQTQHTELMDILSKQLQRDSQNNLQQVLKNECRKDDLSTKSHPSVSASISPALCESVSNSTQTEQDYVNLETKLMAYIDEKLDHFTEKMWEKMDKRFSENEAKIMCKLEEIESFVKPQGIQND